VDIILGLLNPDNDSGQILIDGHIIDENHLKSWQSFIGYVPQQIYLTDDTIAKNIVFGNENLDLIQVEKVSKIAQLHDFVVSELPKKYETIVGERGVKLSGGQRQRIGIARALYNHPKLLVLDEATSALDSITEYKIMKSIQSIGINITTILIAHRLNTIKNCDNIILLEKGKLAGQGNFEKLKKTNTVFNEMTKLNE
jgi:ABC-type multidrug transport system fused ATPase/permease subunit